MEWTVEGRTDHVVVTPRGTFNVAEHRRMVEDHRHPGPLAARRGRALRPQGS